MNKYINQNSNLQSCQITIIDNITQNVISEIKIPPDFDLIRYLSIEHFPGFSIFRPKGIGTDIRIINDEGVCCYLVKTN